MLQARRKKQIFLEKRSTLGSVAKKLREIIHFFRINSLREKFQNAIQKLAVIYEKFK